MDFMKIIKSLEQLLYELMVWLVFYPRTLWLAATRPLRLMEYADEELGDEDEDRYSDTLSPPIFLAISLGLVHLFELATALNIQTEGMLADDKNLIAFRIVAFAIFPLVLSLVWLRARRIPLDRKTLRPPFYAQCFVVVPFALGVDASVLFLIAGVGGYAMAALFALSLGWYLSVQTIWFRRTLESGWAKALLLAFLSVLIAMVMIFGLAWGIDSI